MRKFLLALACTVAVTASAQKVEKIQMDRTVSKVQATSLRDASHLLDGGNAAMAKAPQKAAADNVWYRTPAGSMWMTVNQPLYTYKTPYLIVAPWTEIFYQNMSYYKNGQWSIVTASTEIDLSDDVDEEGNLNYGKYAGGQGGYYAPQYTEAEVTYIPANGENNMAVFVNDVNFHTFMPTNVDPKYYGGGSLAPYGNLYGAGYIEYKGEDGEVEETGVTLGFIYNTPKPMSPLYVEGTAIWAIQRDNTIEPMPEGTVLTMDIINRNNPDAEPVRLTCDYDQLVFDSENNGSSFYMMYFTQKVLDEDSGDLVAEPFVIDYPAEIQVFGFDQEGVTIGLLGMELNEEFLADDLEDGTRNPLNQAYFVTQTESGKQHSHYYQNCVPVVGFFSMFDVCEVVTEGTSVNGDVYDNVNTMVVSADGNECGNYIFTNIEGVEVQTALDWEDETSGEEMYWSDDMYEYEWIQNLTASQVEGTNGPVGGAYYVGAVCDELPSDVKVRYACIHLNGRGVTSGPIIIIQGDGTVEEAVEELGLDGVKGVSANAKSGKTYNLMGQEVKANAKGIIIRDGKKFVNM